MTVLYDATAAAAPGSSGCGGDQSITDSDRGAEPAGSYALACRDGRGYLTLQQLLRAVGPLMTLATAAKLLLGEVDPRSDPQLVAQVSLSTILLSFTVGFQLY